MALSTRRPALRLIALVALLATAGLLTSACGSSDDEESAATTAGPTTTAEATTTTVTPTAEPATFEAGLLARWSDELGDPQLAADLIDQIGPDAITQFEDHVGLDDVMTDPLLAMTPPTVPDDEVDQVVVYAFGNRVAADGTLSPGPTNEELAQATADFVADHPVSVFAQWEVADLLIEQGVPGVTSIDPEVGPDGELVYLSTAGVADKIASLFTTQSVDLGQVGVIAFQDHAVRSVLASEGAGMDGAAVPEGVDLPSAYDAESGQEWTRDQLTYLTTDLQGRLLLIS